MITFKRFLLTFSFILMVGLNASAYTEVPGFDGETWLDHVNEDDIFNPNFGDGSKDNPWKILSAEGLAFLSQKVKEGNTYEGVYFEIAKDINLSRYVWVPIGLDADHAFKGTITNGSGANGNPYKITGMKIHANSTETAQVFGLFGVLQGTVEGLILTNSQIIVDGAITNRFNVGTICGILENNGTNTCNVTKCTVESTDITIKGFNVDSDNIPCVGGLIGDVNTTDVIQSNLARNTSMRIEGPVKAGGVAGECYGQLKDCHSVVTMNVKNSSDLSVYLGGILGNYQGYGNIAAAANRLGLLCCTSCGDITGDGNNITMGGLIGYVSYSVFTDYCTTSVSLAGAHTMGGLIGCISSFYNAEIFECFCSSFVDAKKATYAGGLVGYIDFWYRYNWGNYGYCNITPVSNSSVVTTFAGTMTKPESSESKYGMLLGYANKGKLSSPPSQFLLGFFMYDAKMCNLQLTGCDWYNWNDNNKPGVIETPKTDSGVYAYYQEAWLADRYQSLYGEESFYTENMRVAGAPFNITNELGAYFKAYDVTADFSLEKFVNQTTGEELATFAIPTPPSCVQVNEKNVKVLDPGEVVVVINTHGAQRKVHLDITYGIPWDGNSENYNFIAGDGSAKSPYVIQSPGQLLRVAYGANAANSAYNKEGVHYILANDLFINNHLLQEDEEPRSDAVKTWKAYNWKAVLHGNGKTIYGLYDTESRNGARGLFAKVSGTIEDLAVVDAYVEAAVDADSISAGIICGELLENGSIARCLTHGVVKSNGYAGGICGYAESSNTHITDCFVAVHVGWPGEPLNYIGAGIVGVTPEELSRCVSISKVENYGDVCGIARDDSRATDCYFDRQMMAANNSSKGSTFTKDLIVGTILNNNSGWTALSGYYPMLKQFAHTPYGQLLSLPISFSYKSDADFDLAGGINQIFEFPTENVRWWAHNGDAYLDVINECGAASPNGRTGDNVEFLIVEPTNSKSECTKPLRVTAVNVNADKAGIMFKDPEAEKACLAAFDNDHDHLVTLREAFETTDEEFKTFNDNAAKVESFTELRFFSKVVNLKEGMLSGLSKLKEIELPKVLTTISTNAFNGCASLEEIEVPYLFNHLEEGGFYGSGIKNILVNSKSTKCRSIDGALYQIYSYNDDKVMLMAYPPGRGEESATISAPLITILSNAIYKVPDLKNVYIDNCLPDGEMAELEEDGIIHEDPNDIMHIYVNDGSYNSALFEEYCDDDMWIDPYFEEDHLDIYYPLNITSAGWATMYIGFPTQLPQGLSAYIASEKDSVNYTVTLTDIGRVIPACTPVVIKGAQGLYPLYRYEGTVPDIAKFNNRFIGSFIGQDDKWGVPVNQETSASGSILTLGHNSAGTLGFFKYNGEMIPPYRAYLTCNIVKEGPLQAAPAFRIVFDAATGIQETVSVRIPADNVYYTLDGRKLQGKPTRRGLYIINGKKIVIK